ncbi:hypothetical protein GQ55_5G165700 [Panicum hallii var. hallii]|uniref:Thioesterase domain-containing protein n=1 Tax=Panicum hallii var. hallii TaxID=1504633 RepID=A0A2T7DH09_9POAL|nr:hypothetical protein GQ55_5G165700 [Panicum hallii var. hallii]
MGDEARARRLTAIARKWLVDPRVGYSGDLNPAASERQELSCMVMAGARVSLAEPGRVVCSLSVRAPLTDAEGRWHAGAVAAAVDNMCSAVVFTVEGAPTVTVQYSLSYFSPAHPDDEVEMEGRVVSRKGKLTSAAVEVRKKKSGELVAIGRQWVAPAWPIKSNKSSKL